MLKLKRADARLLFLIIVVVPTFIGVIYNLFLATPIYVAEAKVVVKSLGGGEMPGGLGSLLSAVGVLYPSTSGAYLVMDHVRSRDVMFNLEGKFGIKEYYSSEEWDILRRFDPFHLDPSYENFYQYYTNRVVEIFLDTNSGVVTLRVRGKDPGYPTEILEELISISEDFVNRVNRRASMTALRYYREQLERSKEKVREFAKKVKRFLMEKKVVAPEQEVGVLLGMVAELQGHLISKQLELSTIESVAPENPKISQLRREIKELKKEIDSFLSKITGRKDSLAIHSVELELLKAELLMLQKEVEMNLGAFLQSQNQAHLQHLFIETVEKPTKPDAPTEPKAGRNIFVIFAISFALWGVVSLLIAGVREHTEE